MKLFKKFVAISLVPLMLVAYIPGVSAADESGVTEDGFKYTASEKGVSITGYTGQA